MRINLAINTPRLLHNTDLLPDHIYESIFVFVRALMRGNDKLKNNLVYGRKPGLTVTKNICLANNPTNCHSRRLLIRIT